MASLLLAAPQEVLAQRPAAAASAPHRVTLITGDRVIASGPDLEGVRIERGAGREQVSFVTQRVPVAKGQPAHLFVIPEDAARLLQAGKVDLRLFDVTLLVESRYDDAHRRDLPFIVTYPRTTAARALPRSVPGAVAGRNLPSVNGMSVSSPKAQVRQLWDTLVAGPGVGGTAAVSEPIGKIWLDALPQPVLDQSVAQIGAPAAWELGYEGDGVIVAVLDTGVDDAHPDLGGQRRRLLPGGNGRKRRRGARGRRRRPRGPGRRLLEPRLDGRWHAQAGPDGARRGHRRRARGGHRAGRAGRRRLRGGQRHLDGRAARGGRGGAHPPATSHLARRRRQGRADGYGGVQRRVHDRRSRRGAGRRRGGARHERAPQRFQPEPRPRALAARGRRAQRAHADLSQPGPRHRAGGRARHRRRRRQPPALGDVHRHAQRHQPARRRNGIGARHGEHADPPGSTRRATLPRMWCCACRRGATLSSPTFTTMAPSSPRRLDSSRRIRCSMRTCCSSWMPALPSPSPSSVPSQVPRTSA